MLPAHLTPKSIWSYNPSPTGCVSFLPLWHPNLSGPAFVTPDPSHVSAAVSGGCTWGVTGRTFDGVDGLIAIGTRTTNSNIFDNGGTAWAWVNTTSDGEGDLGRIFDKYPAWRLFTFDDDGSDVKVVFGYDFDGVADGQWSTTARSLPLAAWHFVAVTYNNGATTNNPTIYVDTTAYTIASGLTEDTTPVGAKVADSTNIGVGNTAGEAACFDGIIGEGGWLTRVLGATELAYIRSRTMFRYQ